MGKAAKNLCFRPEDDKHMFFLPNEDKHHVKIYQNAFDKATVDDPFGKCISLTFCSIYEIGTTTFIVDTITEEAKLHKFMRTFELYVTDAMIGVMLPPFIIMCRNPPPYTYVMVNMPPTLAVLYNEHIASVNILFMEDTGQPHPNICVLANF